MKKIVLLVFLVTTVASTRANAQMLTLIDPTTLNGSFETALATGGKSNKGFDTVGNDVTNWTNTNLNSDGAAAGYTDTGSQNPGAEDGLQFVFFHAGDGGAFNLTTYTIQTSDQFSLTWYGDNNSTVSASLFASTNGAFTLAGTLTQVNVPEVGNTYIQYTLNYTAAAADVGKTIGASFVGVTAYPNVDNVVLTVTQAAVPEPGTYAMLAVSGMGAMVVLRRRRA